MDELVMKLKDNPAFTEFQKYIIEQIDDLDTVEGLEGLTNDQAGEEAKVRSKAREKLYTILEPFLISTKKRETTAEEIHARKQRFGL